MEDVVVMINCSFSRVFTLFLLPSRSTHNLRRSALWRTRWQLWGRTTIGVLVPTLLPRGICRRTWSPPNTSFSECRSSWPWQRRYVTGVALLSRLLLSADLALQFLLCFPVLCAQELEKKFQQTAAYRNMKEILTKKNEQIKEIRKRLQR